MNEPIKPPRNPDYPANAVQCDECGGLGTCWRPGDDAVSRLAASVCPTCDGDGWLRHGHPRGRRCNNQNCEVYLPPDHIAVYGGNICALDDA